MLRLFLCLAVVLTPATALSAADNGSEKAFIRPLRSVFVDNVWSGCPVGFSFIQRKDVQYVAYYNSERQMVVACRKLDSDKWTYQKFDEFIGWDSHNGIAMTFDSEGYIHLSGNMHCVPLKYYRTAKPEDITTFERIPSLTGELENRVTYPRFTTGPNGEFLFSYRDGGSGNGSEIVKVYDVKTKSWKRYIDTPLFNGEGERNAYFAGPIKDKKGFYHIAWCWREDPDCATNHDVSYAKSPNYRDSFQKSDGTPIPVPITLENAEIIDPIPVQSGLLNSVKLSLDSQDRVMVTYIKFDPWGKTQLYTARREDGGWRIYRTTRWKDRWDFKGGGSIHNMISNSSPQVWSEGKLFQVVRNEYLSPWQHIRFLDEDTLQQTGEPIRLLSPELEEPKIKHTDDWQVNIGRLNPAVLKNGKTSWIIRWESAGANRDKPRAAIPPPSRLEVIEVAGAE